MSTSQRLRRFERPASHAVIAASLILTACGAPAESKQWATAAPSEGAVSIATEGTTPSVAAGRDGVRFVAWIASSPGAERGQDVMLARHGAGETDPRVVRVNDILGDAAAHGQAPAVVRAGPGGAVYVLWQNNTPIDGRRFPASQLRFSHAQDDSLTFAPAIDVADGDPNLPTSHTFHDMAISPDGTVYVSWIDGRAADAVRAGGEHDPAHVPGPEIRLAKSTDGGRSFSPSVVVDSGACPCCRTALAVGDDGVVYVSWRKHYEGEVRDIVVARSDDSGRSFSKPQRVHDDNWVFPGCPHVGADLAIDARGRLHAVWYTGVEGRSGVYHAVSTDGGRSFSEPLALSVGAEVGVSQARVTAASHGGVWLAWETVVDLRRHVQVAALDDRGRLLNLGPPMPGSEPALAFADDLLLAWLDDGGLHLSAAS